MRDFDLMTAAGLAEGQQGLSLRTRLALNRAVRVPPAPINGLGAVDVGWTGEKALGVAPWVAIFTIALGAVALAALYKTRGLPWQSDEEYAEDLALAKREWAIQRGETSL